MLYSHVYGDVGGWNIGVVAVISFFVMSGYVMSLLIAKHYPAPSDVPRFYSDRAARLFPQYLLYLALTLLMVHLLGLSDDYLQERGPLYVTANVLMLPLGYYMMFGLDHAVYVPPAWSLGLELTFYLAFPVFWHSSKGTKRALAVLSSGVFLMAFAGIINTDWFGCRLLPGTFFIFVAGTALAQRGAFPAIVCVAGAVAALLTIASPSLYAMQYNKEVTAGIAIGVLAVYLLSKARFSRFDELVGNLSYGVFLNHFLVMWVLDHFGGSRLIVPVISLALAWISYIMMERPALRWRERLRANREVEHATVLREALE